MKAKARIAAFFMTSASLIAMVVVLLTSVSLAAASEGCSNEARREEQGAAGRALPDCRAYELVTPPPAPAANFPHFNRGVPGGRAYMNNTRHGGVFLPEDAEAVQASVDGNALSFTSDDASNQSYAINGDLARRGQSGWSAEGIAPPRTRAGFLCEAGFGVNGWSQDLSRAVWLDGFSESGATPIDYEYCGHSEPALVPGEPAETANMFVRDNATAAFHLVDLTPEGVSPRQPSFNAISADGSHVFFSEKAQLTPDAPPIVQQYGDSAETDPYVWNEGKLHFLTILPDGTATKGTIAAAKPEYERYMHGAEFTHAISSNGERVFFYAGGPFSERGALPNEEDYSENIPYLDGALYLRDNAGQDQSALNGSGECTEPQKACTIQIDLPQGITGAGGNGQFQWASSDGTRVFFTDEEKLTPNATAEHEKADLYEYDLERPVGHRLTDLTANGSEPADVLGVSGASEDGSYLYFVAHGNLTGAQQNSRGATALTPAEGTGSLSGAVHATGDTESSSTRITNVSVSEGEFHVGQEIRALVSGHEKGGTTITACSPSCAAPEELTISNTAIIANTESGFQFTGVGSTELTSVTSGSGVFAPGMAISGLGILPNTMITKVGSGTLTLSQGVVANGARPLSATAANLYVLHAGVTRFIANLDSPGPDVCDWVFACLTARVSANGQYIAFNSIASLTGYDNQPVHPTACDYSGGGVIGEGQPCVEIFRYSAESENLSCASCDPSGEPPNGEFAQAEIPGPIDLGWGDQPNNRIDHEVSNKGQVFFDTMNRLVPTDENDVYDVYEYEGEGATAQLHLISSGKSELPSYFYDATPSGSDVFFVTNQRGLVRSDTATNFTAFDARVGGGFPEPLTPPCEGEGCHPAYPGAPGSASPASASFEGKGNVHPAREGNSHTAKCKKGFVKKKAKCVKQRRAKFKKKKAKKKKKTKKSARRAK